MGENKIIFYNEISISEKVDTSHYSSEYKDKLLYHTRKGNKSDIKNILNNIFDYLKNE